MIDDLIIDCAISSLAHRINIGAWVHRSMHRWIDIESLSR